MTRKGDPDYEEKQQHDDSTETAAWESSKRPKDDAPKDAPTEVDRQR